MHLIGGVAGAHGRAEHIYLVLCKCTSTYIVLLKCEGLVDYAVDKESCTFGCTLHPCKER